jgi:predicted dehydrogenase
MKRYAIVGTGSRSRMYSQALLDTYKHEGILVGYCDTNLTRMQATNDHFSHTLGTAPITPYPAIAFDRMIAEQGVQTVIVTSVDRTHHHYITHAMELGCNVITEKPMAIDAATCQAILDTQHKTGRKLTVTFNYRYAPLNSQIKAILQSGAIGSVRSIHFEWLLDTVHGADYFRRWHKQKQNSGGLMVHKAAHHFDLVNWWLAATPEVVFGFGALAFYGRENAARRGITCFYDRAFGNESARDDPFAYHLEESEEGRELYLAAEQEDGYFRDQSVFAPDATIEDDMALVVRYRGGALMTYHLHAYAPWEGFRIAFNGERGRLEVESVENASRSDIRGASPLPASLAAQASPVTPISRILLRPHWTAPVELAVETGLGDHGGGDSRLLEDLFVGRSEPDPLQRAADHIAGAYAILPGIAANRVFARSLPVHIADLVKFPQGSGD